MRSFKMAQPRSLAGALAVLGGDDDKVRALAGGTDLLGLIKDRIAAPEMLVNLKGIDGLGEITETARGLEIGALVKLADLAEDARLRVGWPAIHQSLLETATPQLRNVGTLGGNLCQRPRCWYFRNEHYDCKKKGGTRCFAHDGENEYHAVYGNGICCIVHPSNLAGPMIAQEAIIEVAGPEGRREVTAEAFFTSPDEDVLRENQLAPGELVVRVILPPASPKARSVYVETRERQSFDWALCGVSVVLTMADQEIEAARVVFNAVAPVPLRRHDLEGMLEGRRLNEATVDKVCLAAPLGANPLEQNAYKLTLMKAVLRRALNRLKESAR
ncbi:MAG: xanthine dehydrogenase family protein subunit M [Planctomycetes bacterium]|nr:xanthine dehydrogenase family protein subunit M [Planctomycetota bacterium]